MLHMFSFSGELDRKGFLAKSFINLLILAMSAGVVVVFNRFAENIGLIHFRLASAILSLLFVPVLLALAWRQTALLGRRFRNIGWDSDLAIIFTIAYAVVFAMSLSTALQTVAGLMLVAMSVGYLAFFALPPKKKKTVGNDGDDIGKEKVTEETDEGKEEKDGEGNGTAEAEDIGKT